jgi:hypothetical protein
MRQKRVKINEVAQPVGNPFGNGTHDHPGIPVAGQDDVLEVFLFEKYTNILNVGLQPG